MMDRPPEHTHYQDTGCDLQSHCLTCPLHVCKEEVTQGAQTVRARMRKLQIILLRDEGHSVGWIAHVMGISRQTVYRAVEMKSCNTAPLTDTTRRTTINIAAMAIATDGR